MPAYHSKFNDVVGFESACGCALLPLKTAVRGPAPAMDAAEGEDVLDEVIKYYRANSLFKNFDVAGEADRTFIYLTLFLHLCLKECERAPDREAGAKALKVVSVRRPAAPGEAGFPLGQHLTLPGAPAEADAWKAYMKQARDELSQRALGLLYHEDGSKNKWWQLFSKFSFMGKVMKQ